MADKKISQLDPGGAPQNADAFPIARSGQTLQVAWSDLAAAVSAEGPAGLDGNQGQPGAAGATGATGIDGLDGNRGATGLPGGALTFPYIYSSRRDATPSAGQFSWYEVIGTWAAGTLLAIPNYTDANGVSWKAALDDLLANVTSALFGFTPRRPFLAHMRVWSARNPAIFVEFPIEQYDDADPVYYLTSAQLATITDSSADPFADGELVYLTITPSGPIGQPGGGLAPEFFGQGGVSAQTDPGTNNLTWVAAGGGFMSAATAFCLSYTDRSGVGVQALIDAMFLSTSPTPGFVHVFDINDPAQHGAFFAVTGFTDHSTYAEIAVTYIAGGDGFYSIPSVVAFAFTPTGNLGATGADGAAGAAGADGIDGLQGAQGLTGATGATGAQGVPGIDGLDGARGLTGAAGAAGSQGTPGIDGIDGAQGAQGGPGGALTIEFVYSNRNDLGLDSGQFAFWTGSGRPWTHVTGPTYTYGSRYDLNGVDWKTSLDALDGGRFQTSPPLGYIRIFKKSDPSVFVALPYQEFDGPTNLALDWWVANLLSGDAGNVIYSSADPFTNGDIVCVCLEQFGITGTAGVSGIDGLDGQPGSAGATGATGSSGSTGSTGAQGVAGLDGIDGLQGPQGIQGVPGIDGLDGQRGPTGATGAQGPTSQTVQVQVPLDTPDSSGNGFPGLSTNASPGGGFTNVRRIVPSFTKSVDGTWEGSLRVPNNYSSAGTVILSAVANATSGAVRWIVSTSVVAASASEDPAYTAETAQNITVAGTARQRFDATFTLSTTPAAGSTLNVKVTRQGTNIADTLTVDALLWECIFQYVSA